MKGTTRAVKAAMRFTPPKIMKAKECCNDSSGNCRSNAESVFHTDGNCVGLNAWKGKRAAGEDGDDSK